MAQLNINLSKIEYNARVLQQMLTRKHIHLTPVLKSVASDHRVIERLNKVGLTHFADSRLNHLTPLRDTDNTFTLLRPSRTSEYKTLVETCKMSIQTELSVIRELNEIAASLGKKHQIMLMVDWKDGREGILTYDLTHYVKEILPLRHINLVGIAFNFMCFNSIAPTEDDVAMMTQVVDAVESDTGHHFRVISGGNSSMLPLLMYSDLERINELRIGETLFRGIDTTTNVGIASLYQDCITLEAEILEIQPRIYLETGNKYLQAIVDIGQLDTMVNELKPIAHQIEILGATSDQLMLDLKGQDFYQVGDTIHFSLGYSALSLCMFQDQLERNYEEDKGIEAVNRNFSVNACSGVWR